VQLSRRNQILCVDDPARRRTSEPISLIVDRSGLKICGHTQDPTAVPELLAQLDVALKRFVADGIYDNATVYGAIAEHPPGVPVDVVVPPRRNAAPSRNAATSPTQRDEHIARIQSDGLSQWRWESGTYAQSGVENAFSRYKAIFGGHLRAKRPDSQEREAQLGCAILNQLRALGAPLSVRVE